MADIKQVKLVLTAILAAIVAYPLMGAIVWAIVLAYISFPIFSRINSIIGRRGISAGITTFGILLVIVYPVISIIRSIFVNSKAVSASIGSIASNVVELLGKAGFVASGTAQAVAQKVINSTGGFLFETPRLFVSLFVMLTLLFYFLRDGPEIKKYILSLARDEKQISIIHTIDKLMKAVIVGNFASAFVIGIASWFGFMLLGFKHAMLFGTLVGIAAILPVLGTWMIYTILAFYFFFAGNYFILPFIIFFGIIMEFAELYLRPFICSEKLEMHPALLIIGFLGGPFVFGITGIIIGPLALGILKVILDHYKTGKK